MAKLIQLLQNDGYLEDGPTITFFKVVYRRRTNFSLELPEWEFCYKKNNRKYNNFDIIVSNCDENEKKKKTNCLKMITF